MLWSCFTDRKVPNAVERCVFHGPSPALQRWASLQFRRFVHDELPGSRRNLRIARGEIGPRDLQVYGGLLLHLVFGVQQPLGGRPVLGEEAGLLFGERFFDVEGAPAQEQNESAFHGHDVSVHRELRVPFHVKG